MKLIDLINKIYKRDIETGFRFTLKYKEFTLNTYEIRKCEYGLMIWDLDNDSRFDSNEYIFDYLDYEIIEEEKEMKIIPLKKRYNPEATIECNVKRLFKIIDEDEIKINELIIEVNKLKKEGK